jgi:hypothetical protein
MVSSPALADELFGNSTFSIRHQEGDWVLFKRNDARAATLWHGTTLHQWRIILEQGIWRPGLWVPASATSPLAVWLTDSRAMAMDRASVQRGWACSLENMAMRQTPSMRPTIPDGWDTPIVLGMHLMTSDCGLHRKFANGHHCRRYLADDRTAISLEELHIQEVCIHCPTYERYNALPMHWHELHAGQKVLCRTQVENPEIFFKGGHGCPLSCGRVCVNSPKILMQNGWRRANETKEWRCPECDRNHLLKLGSVTGDF